MKSYHYLRTLFSTCYQSLLPILVGIAFLFSCTPDRLGNAQNVRVFTSTDSLRFDTIFTTRGSITAGFKIYNPSSTAIEISEVALGNRQSSSFSINVNGTPGPVVNNIRIEKTDSVYVFVKCTIDPNNEQTPFLVNDSITIKWGNNQSHVQLEAFGKNAYFLRNHTVRTDTTFSAEKPIVIFGNFKIEAQATLTIAPGTAMFMNANAPWIIEGNLMAKGTKDSIIVFTGDRLDRPYSTLPSSWPGLVFMESSTQNQIQFTRIQYAFEGIIAAGVGRNNPIGDYGLTLENVEVNQCFQTGIKLIASSVFMNNCLMVNSGSNLMVEGGGNYLLRHSTFASFGNRFIPHTTPSVLLNNYLLNGTIKVEQPLTANFQNCIIWGGNGTVDKEIVLDGVGSSSSISLTHCLFKESGNNSNINAQNSIRNQDPLFDSIAPAEQFYRYQLKLGSPAIDLGNPAFSSPSDFTGRLRTDGKPDAGCYELFP